MYFLGTDYVVSSILWLVAIGFFVYTVKDPVLRYFNNKGNFQEFENDIKQYLKETYPDVKFDYTIIDTTKNEPSEELRKNMIIDDIVTQFKKLTLNKSKFPKATNAAKLWSSYTFNCEPNKNKLPPDMPQRINALLTREKQKCFRCSKKLKISTAHFYMLVGLEKGGKYQLENLVSICIDCKKILNNDPSKTGALKIQDDLYEILEDSL
jgi:hypothetical protein